MWFVQLLYIFAHQMTSSSVHLGVEADTPVLLGIIDNLLYVPFVLRAPNARCDTAVPWCSRRVCACDVVTLHVD